VGRFIIEFKSDLLDLPQAGGYSEASF